MFRVPTNKSITTYNYAVADRPRLQEYIESKFLFGQTVFISSRDMKLFIDRPLDRKRKNVFVGHSFGCHTAVLKAIDVDLKASVFVVLDTRDIAREVLRKRERLLSYSLGRILECIPGVYTTE
jgi:hypothetical protein